MAKRTTPWKSQVKVSSVANTYVGTPSLVMDGSGVLWASFVYFGSATSANVTDIYKSTDDGATWTLVRTITGLFYTKYFLSGGNHYLLGTAGGRTNLIVYYSNDEWATAPSSVTVASGNYVLSSNQHLEKDGFLFFGVNEVGSTSPAIFSDYDAVILYADTADLTNAANWRTSNAIAFNQAWTGTAATAGQRGFIEGNVVDDGGSIVSLWRVGNAGTHVAGLITSTWDSVTPSLTIAFDDSTGFVNVPGGAVQFSLNYDSTSSRWYSFANHDGYGVLSAGTKLLAIETDPNALRHELWLSSASSLSGTWTPHCRILRDEIEASLSAAFTATGFQYVSPVQDGQIVKFISRTAYDGAATEHDSNRITYHEINDIAKLIVPQTASTLTSSWSGYAEFSVPSSLIDSDLTGFPVIIDLAEITDSDFWDAVREDGADIRATDENDAEIPVSVNEFCRQSQVGKVLCKRNLSSSSATIVRIWVGNASAGAYATTDTYGRDNVFDANHKLVIELAQLEPPNLTGLTSGSTLFKGSLSRRTDYLEQFSNQSTERHLSFADDADLDIQPTSTGITLECTIDADDLSGGDTFGAANPRYVINKADGPISNYWIRLLGTKVDFGYRNASNTSYVIQRQTTGSLTTTQDHHVAAVHDGSSIVLYVDGAAVTSSTVLGAATTSAFLNADRLYFGGYRTTSSERQFVGTLRGQRIHNTARSAAWIKASANNHLDPATFAAYQGWFQPVGLMPVLAHHYRTLSRA